MDFGDWTTCITVPCAKSVLRGRNGIGTPRQRGDCAVVSGLSFRPGAVPRPSPPRPPPLPPPAAAPPAGAAPPPACPPARPAPPRPPWPCAPATSGGILPSGGSMIIEVRLPVFRTELKTAL